MKTIVSVGIALFLTTSVAAGEEFVDDFRSSKLEGRLAEHGDWQFRDGIAAAFPIQFSTSDSRTMAPS